MTKAKKTQPPCINAEQNAESADFNGQAEGHDTSCHSSGAQILYIMQCQVFALSYITAEMTAYKMKSTVVVERVVGYRMTPECAISSQQVSSIQSPFSFSFSPFRF